MGKIVTIELDSALVEDFERAAGEHGRSLEAELMRAITAPRFTPSQHQGSRRALAEEIRLMLPEQVQGSTGTSIIRWYRDTEGGREPDVFGR